MRFLKKEITILQAFWQRALTHRFDMLMYRVGEVSELLMLVLMWTAIFGGQETIKGFTLQEMITYLLVGNFFGALVRNYLSEIVARDIRDGALSMSLVRPVSYFRFVIAREIGRISMATTFSALTTTLVIVFFSSRFLWNTDICFGILILCMLILAFCVELLLSYLVGLLAFWVDEVDGIFSSISRLRNFFSGGYFPLNLLPTLFVQISFCLPFAYSFFVPAQLYLKKMSLIQGMQGLLVQVVWLVLLYVVIQVVWKRGLKKYEGVGI